MNRSLRKRHLRMVLVSALVVPIGLVAALSNRAEYPFVDALEWAPGGALSGDSALGDKSSSTQVLGVEVELRYHGGTDSGGAVVVLSSRDSLQRPDVLAYWSTGTAAPGDDLPPDVRLLGSFSGASTRQLELPDAAGDHAGYVLLYSLGHAEVLGSLPLPTR